MADEVTNNLLDSEILSDNNQLILLKRVLEKEFNIATEALLYELREAEDKENNKTSKTFEIAVSTLNKLNEILVADGIISPTEKDYSNWLDTQIESKHFEYKSDGRFDSFEEGDGENIVSMASARTLAANVNPSAGIVEGATSARWSASSSNVDIV